MMLYPALTDLVDLVGNRYRLVNIVSKRAREIAEEAEKMDMKLNEKPVKLATLELYSTIDPKNQRKD
jgi:DNA-directed RNA polymerase omega subunit